MPKPISITGDWYDSESAGRALKLSVRRVQELALRGKLEFKTVREGRRRIRLYSAASIEQYKRARAEGGASESKEVARALPTPAATKLTIVPSPAPLGLFLTLEQASLYSGLTVTFLRKLISQQKLFALRGGERGTWVISRASLENFAGRRRFR